MPEPHPDEFRQRADGAGPKRRQTGRQHSRRLGIATSCLRRWMKQDDIDGGGRDG